MNQEQTIRAGLRAVQSLMDESYGVSGLHLNGEIAPWISLRTGGHFEEWLVAFDEAEKFLDHPIRDCRYLPHNMSHQELCREARAFDESTPREDLMKMVQCLVVALENGRERC